MTQQQYHVLSLFKLGLDTVDIAKQLMLLESEAYSLLRQAREHHRRRT